MSLKIIAGLAVLISVTGCATTEERLAKRVNCDPTQLTISNQVHAPAYAQYNFDCEGSKYTCRDAPFLSSCNEAKDALKE